MNTRIRPFSLLFGFLFLRLACSADRPFPPTERRPLTDDYFGIKVFDVYTFLFQQLGMEFK